MAYVDEFEPSNVEKNARNTTGETVVGDPPMGTADQNAPIDAANKTAGEWDGDAPQDGTDSNDEIAEENMQGEVASGNVSSDVINIPPDLLPLVWSDAGQNATYNVAGDATLAITNVNAAIGDKLFLLCAADNAGAAGVSSTQAAITDASGNVWNRIFTLNRTQLNGVNDGVTLSIWRCDVTVALANAPITINFNPVTPAKSAMIKKCLVPAGQNLTQRLIFAGIAQGNSSFSNVAVNVNKGETIMGACAIEHAVLPAGDIDTTLGAWSANRGVVANGGTDVASALIMCQTKNPTATGNQAYNGNIGANRDFAQTYIIFATAHV